MGMYIKLSHIGMIYSLIVVIFHYFCYMSATTEQIEKFDMVEKDYQ